MTTTHNNNIGITKLHPHATKLIKKYVSRYESSLRSQAQIVASQANADEIMSIHVEEALEKVKSANKKCWFKDVANAIGSAMFGISLQGYITELQVGNNILIAIYTLVGFIGMIMVFWGFQK